MHENFFFFFFLSNRVYHIAPQVGQCGTLKMFLNKAGYTAIRCVLAGTDSSFGQKRHFCMVSPRV